MKTRSHLNAGGIKYNHNQTALRIRSAVKAGGIKFNHNETGARRTAHA